MVNWIRDLAKETGPMVLLVFGAASSVLTFVPHLGLGRLSWIALACLVLAFAWANFRVYTKQNALMRSTLPEVSVECQEGWFEVMGPTGDYKWINLELWISAYVSNTGLTSTTVRLKQLTVLQDQQMIVKSLDFVSNPGGPFISELADTMDVDSGQTVRSRIKAELSIPNNAKGSWAEEVEGSLIVSETVQGQLAPVTFSAKLRESDASITVL